MEIGNYVCKNYILSDEKTCYVFLKRINYLPSRVFGFERQECEHLVILADSSIYVIKRTIDNYLTRGSYYVRSYLYNN